MAEIWLAQQPGPEGFTREVVIKRILSSEESTADFDRMFIDEGVVKVLDFGIAKATGRLTRTNTGLLKGKLAYMAPEQAAMRPLDARADVFALGVVLYELLTGARAHGDRDDIGVMSALVS